VVYYQELLSILENNLMSEEMPYFRAIVERTPAKELAETLGANPNTAWRRMKTVRMKVQDIIRALGGHISS
jgi:DNA-binding Lrp family transcriptional regulator